MDDELRAFRDEVRQGFTEVRQEFASVQREFADFRQEVAEQFANVRQEFADQFAGVRQEFANVRQEFARVHQRLDSLDDRVRHDGVLLEAMRSDVRLLAEGHHQLDQKIDRHRAESDREHRETLALIRSVYRELDRRIPRVESGGDPTSS